MKKSKNLYDQLSEETKAKIEKEREIYPNLVLALVEQLEKTYYSIDLTIEYAHPLFVLGYADRPFNLTQYFKLFTL